MRLSATDTTICVGRIAIGVRPTLRTACSLEQHYGGFDKIAKAALEGKLSVLADVLHLGQMQQLYSKAAIEAALADDLRNQNQIISEVLLFVMNLCGLDEKPASQEQPAGKTASIPFAEFHTKLYRIATGWLGWTANEAWQSTPAEIIEAYKGRVELLQCVFGNNQESQKTQDFNAPFDPVGFESLRGLGSAA